MKSLLDLDNYAAPSFHLVVPSLPGFCGLQSPSHGWTLHDTARMHDVLMKRLGHSSYVAQAGDWDNWVVRELGSRRNDVQKVVYTDMCSRAPPKGTKLTEQENTAMDRDSGGWAPA